MNPGFVCLIFTSISTPNLTKNGGSDNHERKQFEHSFLLKEEQH